MRAAKQVAGVKALADDIEQVLCTTQTETSPLPPLVKSAGLRPFQQMQFSLTFHGSTTGAKG